MKLAIGKKLKNVDNNEKIEDVFFFDVTCKYSLEIFSKK